MREELPEGRYGRSADERADRKLKIIGAVLGCRLLALIGWFGYDYVAGQEISAEVIKFEVDLGHAVQVHLEVRKDADATGTARCAPWPRTAPRWAGRTSRFDQRRDDGSTGRDGAYDRAGDQCRAGRLRRGLDTAERGPTPPARPA